MSYFDEKYESVDFLFGTEPNDIVTRVLEYKKRGSVLDLGCGYGKNSLFLASKGFNVVGVDESEEGVRKFQQLVEENNLDNVRVKKLNVTDYDFKEEFDIILSINLFPFLEQSEIKNLILHMKENTKLNGLNVISAFTEENQRSFGYLFKKNELKNFYKDWNILSYEEYLSRVEQHGDGRPHRHGKVDLIARKELINS